MTDVLALEALYLAVKAEFLADLATTSVVFGAKEVDKQINQGTGRANRIVFVPGDPNTGDMGKDLAPSRPGRNPRSIATLAETFTVYIWAYDGSAPNDQLKQYKAARLLYDDWRASLYRSSHGDADPDAPTMGRTTIASAKWVTEEAERNFGEEICVVCSIDAMIPDSHSLSILKAPPIDQAVTTALVPSLS